MLCVFIDTHVCAGSLCHLMQRLHALDRTQLLALTHLLVRVREQAEQVERQTGDGQIVAAERLDMSTVEKILKLIPEEINRRPADFTTDVSRQPSPSV